MVVEAEETSAEEEEQLQQELETMTPNLLQVEQEVNRIRLI